jgi:hypothetical protein
MLGNRCNFSIKALYEWAEKKDLAVVYITGNKRYDGHQKLYATTPEWLYLIDNAEYIITNSFHASLFSLIFQKRFGIIPLMGQYTGMNTRFISLFETLEIKQRFINNSFVVLDMDIDWDKVGNVFKTLRNSCNLFSHIR